MEDREDVTMNTMNDLHRAKNASNHIRLPLRSLSTNISLPKTKQTTLAIKHEKNKKRTADQSIDKIVASFPCQSFKIYTDQEHESVPWHCIDLTVQSTGSEKQGSPAMIIDRIDEFLAVSCEKENVSSDDDSNSDTILPEYDVEIHSYLKEAEQKHRPSRNFMHGQPLINKSMRAILVDWLVEVAEEYHLVPETLHLTINYIDRFLSSKVIIDPNKLQLVGVACMLIASKIEEIYPPEISEFVYITNSTYTIDQIKQMEKLVLKILAFDLAVPTALSFLDRYEKGVEIPAALNQKLSNLTRYYCELMLQDSEVQWKYLPSAVAASSVVLAVSTLGFTSWLPFILKKTGFEMADLHLCIINMHKIVSNASNSNLQAIGEKYRESRFGSVAAIMSCQPVFF